MVAECIVAPVVPFYLEVTMGGGEPPALDANGVYPTVIDEKCARLFVPSVPAAAVNLDGQPRLEHMPFILLLMDKGWRNSGVSWPWRGMAW